MSIPSVKWELIKLHSMAMLRNNTNGVIQTERGLPPFNSGQSASSEAAAAVSRTTPVVSDGDSEGKDDGDDYDEGDDDDDD